MNNRTRKIMGIILSLVIVLNFSISGYSIDNFSESMDFREDIGDNYSDEELKAWSLVDRDNRDSGLIGFEDEYRLGNSGEERTVIVEFKSQPAELSKKQDELSGGKIQSFSNYDRQAKSAHDLFRRELAQLLEVDKNMNGIQSYNNENSDLGITRVYENSINGVALNIREDKIEELVELDSVFAVYPNIEFHQTSSEKGHVNSKGMQAEREYLNIDSIHEKGLTGKGVVVGILDTGVDYNHPDLKDAFKSELPEKSDGSLKALNGKYYGRNLHKDNYRNIRSEFDPMETSYRDWEVVDKYRYPEIHEGYMTSYYTSHGTHVSGIVAGQGVNEPYSAKGMAPDAQLLVYRVLGPYGTGSTDAILEGLDMVVKDGCDIANLSLGVSLYNPYYITSIAINNVILASDIVFSVAAGNDGDKLYSVGSPATAALPITVGNGTTGSKHIDIKANDSNMKLLCNDLDTTFIRENGYYKLKGNKMDINPDGSYDAVVLRDKYNKISTGNEIDFKNNKSLIQNKIIITRGYDYINIARLAKKYEVGGVIALNDLDDKSSSVGLNFSYVPLFLTQSKLQSDELFKSVEKTKKVIFTDYNEIEIPGNKLNDRSSRGPVEGNYHIKPDIIAPGTEVLSTVPSYMIDPKYEDNYEYAYESYSGTSMAAPHIAGIAALMLQAKIPGYEVKSRMMNTGNHMTGYSIYEKGGGYINPERALSIDNYADVEYTNIIRKSNIGLIRDSANIPSISFRTSDLGKEFSDEMTINIHNANGKKFKAEIEYNLEGREVKDINDTGMEISLSSNVFTESVDVNLYVPENLQTEHIGSYEGYIVIKEIEDETNEMKIPFAYYLNQSNDANAFDYIFFNRPSISVGDDRHLEMSSNADLYFGMARDIMEIEPLIVDPDTHEIIGRLYTESNLILKDAYNKWGYGNDVYIEDLVKDGKYYPVEPGKKDKFLDEIRILDEGYHKINIRAYTGGNISEDNYIDLYVDNNKPEIEEIYGLEGNKIVYEKDKNIIIKGKIFDKDIENMKALDIKYSLDDKILKKRERVVGQSLNAIVGEINNNYYKADIDEEGNFTLKIDEEITEDSTLKLYIYDHYTPKLVTKGVIEKGFDPNSPSYEDIYYRNYGYIGNNMETMDIDINIVDIIDAKEPIIIKDMDDMILELGDEAKLSIEAKSLDGGELTYKWYKNNEPSNEKGLLVGTGRECEVLTSYAGVDYYYVEITNTREDVSGNKSASIKSDLVRIEVKDNSIEDIEYNIEIKSGPGGSVKDINNIYNPGDLVKIEAIPDDGYEFVNWESDSEIIFENNKNTITEFTMIDKDVSIIANFKEIDKNDEDKDDTGNIGQDPSTSTPASPVYTGGTSNYGLENSKEEEKSYIKINGKKIKIDRNNISKSIYDINIDSRDNSIDMQISYRELSKLLSEDKNLLFRIRSNMGIYTIPANILEKSIEFDNIIKDNKIRRDDINLRFVMGNKIDDSFEDKLDKQFINNKSLSDLFGFEIQILNKDNKNIGVIDKFKNPVTILKALDSNIKNLPINFGTFKYDIYEEEFRFTPHTYKIIDNNKYVEISTKESGIFKIIENDIEYMDVKNNAWYYNSVKLASSKGLVKGVGYNMYKPDLELTRAEFIQMISNLIDLNEIDDTKVYSDISVDDWYYKSVMQAKSSGILKAFDDEEFNGNKEITREEIASVVAKSIKYLEFDINNIDSIDIRNIFSDHSDISPDYIDDIKLVYGLNIMEGMGNSRFAPKESLTRAQGAKVQVNLLRFLEYIDK